MAEWLLLAPALAAAGWPLLECLRAERAARAADRALRQQTLRAAELAAWLQCPQRLADLQALSEQGIDGTARLVRGIHRGIAAIPFTVLEAIPVTRDTARLVRGVHDLTVDGVYGAIGVANRVGGKGLRAVAGLAERDADD